ncbi:hypothetical protein, partial [uncultured Victivallis sp.]|uniref:hypothetical protein n=1 Tax=uncultured Victivallis sp. TaxID=354118 RepID=UPI0025F2ED07
SGECLKTRDFEVQSECPNTAATSTIIKSLPIGIPVGFFRLWGRISGGVRPFTVQEGSRCLRIFPPDFWYEPDNFSRNIIRRLFDEIARRSTFS